IFYGVGTLVNGSPDFAGKPAQSNSIGPTFTKLHDTVALPWAAGLNNESLGDANWNTAVMLAMGTFDTGVTPAFYQNDGLHLKGSGSVYTSVPASAHDKGLTAIVNTLDTIVRTNFDPN